MRNIIFFFLFSMTIHAVQSQELNATVRVLAPSLQLSDKSVVDQMEKSIAEFLNNQKFTADNFGAKERIKCNFLITISKDLGNNNFSCELTIQSVRPVFNASYETTVLNLADKDFQIHFDPYKAIENSRETYYDNLSSVLTFYAYTILMMDYESFALEGGETSVTLLQTMLNNMSPGAKAIDKSWNGSSSKKISRYDIIENMTNSRMKPYRRAFYEYHRLGVDFLDKDLEQAKRTITSAIESIANVDQAYPNSYLVQLFASAKGKEIVEIFKKASPIEKTKVYNLMISIDPSNTSIYSPLKL